MNNFFTYYMPTKIVYEVGSINQIDHFIDGRKTLLVTSSGFVKRGLIEKLNKLTGDIVHVVSTVKSHPEFKDLEIIYNEIRNIDYELILAIGGGSVLDASKLLSVYNEDKTFSFVDRVVRGILPREGYKLIPRISVPTTSGTSSEITPWASIWDMEEKKKYSLFLPDLYSQVAVYDPNLTLSVPKDITVQTGLDALSHALESIWNKYHNPISTNFAITASLNVLEYLPKLLNNNSLEYRERMMFASMNAGLAFSNTRTAIAHGISYYLTANYGIPHGIACSFTLPSIVNAIKGKYAHVDKAFEIIFKKYDLNSFFNELNISTNLSDYILNNKSLLDLIKGLGDNERANNSLISINELFDRFLC